MVTIKVLKVMLASLNLFLSFRFNVEDTPLYGSQLDNGTWVGMVAFVKNQVFTELSLIYMSIGV